MRADQARQIPINRVCEWLGLRQSHVKGVDTWFFSPWIPEQETASFKTSSELNTWIDFSQTGQNGKQYRGGSSIDLWLDMNGYDRRDSNGFKKALEALSTLEGYRSTPAPLLGHPEAKKTDLQSNSLSNRYKLNKKPSKIWLDSLKKHLEWRGITLAVAMPYLKQAYFTDTKTGKNYNGFAFQNDRDGWEISVPQLDNRTYKTVIGHKAQTTLAGQAGNRSAAIFEGFFDLLAWQQMNGTPNLAFDRVYILNSVTTITPVIEKVKNNRDSFDRIFLFTDNDPAGEQCAEQVFNAFDSSDIPIMPQNHRYSDYKDLSAWLSENKGYKLSPNERTVKVWFDSNENSLPKDDIPKFTKY